MSQRSSARLVLLLAALAIGVVLLARTFLSSDVSADGEFTTAAVVEKDAAPPAKVVDLAVPAPAVEKPSAPRPEPAREAPAPNGDRAAAATAAELELAEAQWVTGFLRFPEGTPIGEVVEVVADGKKFKHREAHRARVGSDGSFRVAFSKDTKSGRLSVAAPHVFLPQTVSFRVAEKASGHVLEPELGGRIVGTVVPPEGVADAHKELERTTVNFFGWSPNASSHTQRATKVDANGRFELNGLPTHVQSSVSSNSRAWGDGSASNLDLTPGEDTAVELRMSRGVHVSGKVVDESGQVVPGATLSVQIEQTGGSASNHFGEQSAGKTGDFDFPGLDPGKITIGAQKKGYQDGELELGLLADGDVREGLELRLSGGAFVAGKVVWPDGRPVEKATVRARPVSEDEDSGWRPPGSEQFATAADGSFKITGLGEGPFHVTAFGKAPAEEAAAPDEPRAEGAVAAARKLSTRAPKWTAKQESVAVGSESLVLTLQPGFTLTGTVVDDLGAPVKAFTLSAKPEEEDSPLRPAIGSVSGRSTGEDGSFTLEGLSAGAWRLRVKAKGYVTGEGVPVQVPERLALGAVTVARAAVLRGVVLGPDGAPVARAQVELESESGEESSFEMFGSSSEGTTNSKGQFEFKSAPSGNCTLTAGREGMAASLPLEVSVAPGQTIEGLSLTLRRGGRMVVEIAPGAGSVSGREVTAYLSSEGSDWRSTRTDASGRATLEGLIPGTWSLTLEPSKTELGALVQTEDEEEDWQLRSSLQKHAQVEVADGETAHVVLGAPPAAPVELRGIVRRGGAPLAGARIQVYPVDHEHGYQTKFAIADAQGAYRVSLDEAGRYSIGACERNSEPTQSRMLEIPSVATFVHDIELATGSIAGRVLGPDGAALAGASVQLGADSSAASQAGNDISSWRQTDEAGAFQFQDLPAGVYSLSVSGEMEGITGPESEGSVPLGNETVRGLELAEGGALRDVTVRLQPGGVIKGRVRSAGGAPAEDAFVTFRESSGALHPNLTGYTDENGVFECRGLAAGQWTAIAVRGGEVSAESAPVRVSAGATVELDLDLRSGTELQVEVVEKDGTPVGAGLSVRDARGREMPSWFSGEVEGGSGLTFGPLAPGAYTVTASNHDGGQASAQVTVDGEATKSVRLTLGG